MSTRRSARLSAATELKASTTTSQPQPPPDPASRGPNNKRKAQAETAQDESKQIPKTPPKKRAKRTSTPSPPSHVQPKTEPAMSDPQTPASKKPRAAGVERLADANITLATLLSPETSRVVKSSNNKTAAPLSPSKKPAETPINILEEANRHLIAVDPRMRPLVEKNYCRIFSPEGLAEEIDPFESLCSSIISQQVSGAAAKAIKKRFVALFHPDQDQDGADVEKEDEPKLRFPHPSQVIPMSIEKLRTAGLSQRKAEYVSGLAAKFVSGELSARILADAPYDEIVAKLTAVRGLGLWSVEMFACFALKRIDVFSLGDLGVQRGMAAFVGRDVAKLKSKGGGKFKYMSEKDMTDLADRFRPYRSLFMWYMWRVEATGTDVSTLE